MMRLKGELVTLRILHQVAVAFGLLYFVSHGTSLVDGTALASPDDYLGEDAENVLSAHSVAHSNYQSPGSDRKARQLPSDQGTLLHGQSSPIVFDDGADAAVGSGDGLWPPTPPQRVCPRPPSVAGARLQLAVETVPGGVLLTVTYSCRGNATLHGAATLACGPDSDHAWPSANPRPTCRSVNRNEDSVPQTDQRPPPPETTASTTTAAASPATPAPPAPVPCSAPPTIDNAVATTSSGSRAEYSCVEGYRPAGTGPGGQRVDGLHLDCNHVTGLWAGPRWRCAEVTCGSPPSLPHTTIRFQTTTFDSGAIYLCRPGFVPMHVTKPFATSKCQADGGWSTVNFTCSYVDCGPPKAFLGGNMTYESTHFGSRAILACVIGYSHATQPSSGGDILDMEDTLDLAKVLTIACQRNGSWTGRSLICTPNACSSPPPVAQAVANVKKVTNGSGPVYSTAKYQCATGFVLMGAAHRQCFWNNTWSVANVACMQEALPCASPPYIPGAQYRQFPGQPGRPESVIYTCTEGNVATGIATATCQLGIWTELTLECNPLTCGAPPNVALARAYFSSTGYDSTAAYHCVDGYTGDQEQWVCGVDGQWSGSAPVCRESGCDAPIPVLNSFVQITTGNVTSPFTPVLSLDHSREYTVGTLIRYHCANGLVLLGGSVRRCRPSQLWSGATPRCLRLSCPRLAAPENGQMTVGSYRAGSTAVFSCDDGYLLSGEATLKCGPGRWSGPVPTCSFALPKVTVEAVIGRGTGRNRNATVHGYAGTGRAYLRCIAMEGHPEPTMIWERISGQKELDAKLRKQRTNSGRKSLRAVFKPLLRSHTGIWRCTASNAHGESHADIRLFVYAYCGPPPLVSSGSFLSLLDRITSATARAPRSSTLGTTWNRTRFLFNEQVSYHCNSGHVLVGTKLRTCQSDGTWSGATSACYRSTCGKPAIPDNGHVNGSMYRYGDHVYYGCRVGYQLLGHPSRRCLATSKWSGSAASCRIVDCGPPTLPANTITDGLQFTYGSAVTVRCSSGYVGAKRTSGWSSMQCQANGHWAGSAPNCTLIQCITPVTPRNGQVHYDSNPPARPALAGTVFGHQQCIRYVCELGYTLLGSSRRCCNDLAEWTDDPPRCKDWCDSVSCGRGEKCVIDLRLRQARCQCMTEMEDCRHHANVPVCGNNGVTYASQCSLDSIACRRGNMSIFKESTGICSSLYEGQTHCQCPMLVREPALFDCIQSTWSMLVRVVAAQRVFYRVYAYRVYKMGEKELQATRIYKLHRVMANNGCSCPTLQVGETYLLSGLEGHDADAFQLIASSYSYTRQQVYPRDLAAIHWPCT